MRKFNVGDKVKIIKGYFENMTGTIQEICKEGDELNSIIPEYGVKIDNGEKKFPIPINENLLEKVELSLFEESLVNYERRQSIQFNENDLMSREDFLMEQRPDYIEQDEYLTEMATIGTDRKHNLRVQVNPDRNRSGNPYFKVFNTAIIKSGESKVARFHFKDSGMEYHKDKYLDWNITNNDIKFIKEFMTKPHKDFTEYSNWQMTCYLWNYEYGFDIDRIEYFNGEYDEIYLNDASYIPSTTEMPDEWLYDPPKKKSKRK